MRFTVHYTLRSGMSGCETFETEYGVAAFERYLDAIGASYECERA